MSTEVIGRILQRTKELGLSPRAASLKAGMSDSAIRDMVRRPSNSPTLASLQKLAVALDTTPEWLAYGSDGGPAEEDDRPRELDIILGALVHASYGGIVEAGAYRPVADHEDDPNREPLIYPRDPRFPQASLFVFDVAGDSMNALEPRPILPGDRLLCISIEAVRIPLRTGMVVIVEQVINGGLLRERSVKQIEEHPDRFEFCPRSRNSRHKPIVVPRDFKVDEGKTVAVIAIVRSIVNTIPL